MLQDIMREGGNHDSQTTARSNQVVNEAEGILPPGKAAD